MRIEINIRYTHVFTPPRCRKPRSEEKKAKVALSIRETTMSRVIPAFIVKCFQDEERKVIQYQGRLYRQTQCRRKGNESLPIDQPLFLNQRADTYEWEWYLQSFQAERGSKEDYISELRRKVRRYLIVDGDVYERCCEPYYSVTTFGLGRNHGGTGLFVSWAEPLAKKIYGWSALDTQAVIEGAVRVALNRGDTKSEEHLRKGGNGNIKTLLPSAVRCIYENPDKSRQILTEEKIFA